MLSCDVHHGTVPPVPLTAGLLPDAVPRYPQSRTTRRRTPRQRPAAHPRRRRIRQDPGHHQPHRLSRRQRRSGAARSARGHLHQQGRGRDARPCRDRCSDADCSRMWVSTFHSLCARLLRREAPAIGLSRDFVIYDSSDQLVVVKQAMKAAAHRRRLRSAAGGAVANQPREEPDGEPRADGGSRGLESSRRADREDLRVLRAGAQGVQRARFRRSAAEDRRALRAVQNGSGPSTRSSSAS